MEGKKNVLGIEIDDVTVKDTIEITKMYLDNNYLNMIYFLGIDTLLLSQKDEEVRGFIDEADLILAGDTMIQKNMQSLDEYNSGSYLGINYMGELLLLLSERLGSVYILSQEQRYLKNIGDYLDKEASNIKYIYQYFDANTEAKLELLVNNINVETPDVLFLIGDNKLYQWLKENKTKINVKLCICIGDVYRDMLPYIKEIPQFIKKCHLIKPYRWLIKEKKIHNIISRIIFYYKTRRKK